MTANDPCSNQASMMLALLNNVISSGTYDAWVSNYFSPAPIPQTQYFDAAYILHKINYPNPNCDLCVQVTYSPGDVTDNSDITFDVVPIESGNTTVYYTITLFNAFFAIVNPIIPIAGFGFTKANKAPTGSGQSPTLDIIFQVIFADQTIAPVCWDLSGTVPPPPSN